MRSLIGVAAALLASLLTLLLATSAQAQLTEGEATTAGFRVVVIDSSGELVVPDAGGSSGDPGDVMVVVSSCAEQLVGIIDCSAPFAQYCADAPADDRANQWRPALMMTRREAAISALAAGSWTCLNFVDVVAGPTQEQIRAVLDAHLPTATATTDPTVSPTSGMVETLVRLPLILHYDDPRDLVVEEVIAGRQVRITGYAESFLWTAGDNTVNTDEVGTPYRTTSPCDHRACRGYLTAPAFDRTGQYRLTLAVTWSGSYQIDGGAPIQITDTITRTSDTLAIHVREARAELVAVDDEYR